MICNKLLCTKTARWRIGFKVWALGYSKERSLPLTGELELYVCDEHKDKMKIEDILSAGGKERIQNELIKHNKALADFTTAELHFTPV